MIIFFKSILKTKPNFHYFFQIKKEDKIRMLFYKSLISVTDLFNIYSFIIMDDFESTKKSQNNAPEDISPIALLKQPEVFKTKFYELTCIASQAIKNKNYKLGIKTLTKCDEMLDIGKGILKTVSKYWKTVIWANLACSYQGVWNIKPSHRFCQKVQDQLSRLCAETQNKQTKLKINFYSVKLRFQHCALYSQLNDHNKALEHCKSTIPILKQIINEILTYVDSLKQNKQQHHNIDIVEFKSQVIQYAETILKDLLKTLNEEVQVSMQRPSFYYWQKNPQNNEEQIKKKFVPTQDQNCKRSILGVNKSKHWINQFNIGAIMHMNQLTLTDFQNPPLLEQYLFKDKLFELIIYSSVAHFTIATELRFLDSARKKQQKEAAQKEKQGQQKQGEKKISKQNIKKKYFVSQKSQIFKLSQAYHLRAIDIMARNIKHTVPYISHLIQSYDKHYIHKKQLDPIMAIVQESSISVSDQGLLHSGQKNNFTPNKSLVQQQSHQSHNVLSSMMKKTNFPQIEQVQIYYESNQQMKPPLKSKNTPSKSRSIKHSNLTKYKSLQKMKISHTKIQNKQTEQKHKKSKKSPDKVRKQKSLKHSQSVGLSFKPQSITKTKIKFVFKSKK